MGVEARCPDHNIPVIIQPSLGLFRCFGVNKVKLNMFATFEKAGFHCTNELKAADVNAKRAIASIWTLSNFTSVISRI